MIVPAAQNCLLHSSSISRRMAVANFRARVHQFFLAPLDMKQELFTFKQVPFLLAFEQSRPSFRKKSLDVHVPLTESVEEAEDVLKHPTIFVSHPVMNFLFELRYPARSGSAAVVQ